MSEAESKLEKQIRNWKGWAVGALVSGFLAGLVGLVPLLSSLLKEDHLDFNKLGNFGSYLQGAVGSLWSLAGFLFIYVAFLAQRLSMLKQDEASREQKLQFDKQMDQQKTQFELQFKSTRLHDFENSFFQLLGAFDRLVSDLQLEVKESPYAFLMRSMRKDTHPDRVVVTGRMVLDAIHGDFKSASPKIAMGGPGPEPEGPSLVEYYELFSKYQSLLSHYFETLFVILKFIDESTVENKQRYANLIRAQLSASELALLNYHGLMHSKEDLKDLIVRYELLKNLDILQLLFPEHASLYPDSAYGLGKADSSFTA